MRHMTRPGAGASVAKNRSFHLVQALRLVAAVMVIVLHASTIEEERFKRNLPLWHSGAAGVDIFFVVSGFVMALSSRSLVGCAGGWWAFLKRRLERIVPLYWIFTTLKVVMVLCSPALAMHGLRGPWHVIDSYLFIPDGPPTPQVLPVVSVGWTLNFEMLFYLLFAAALATGRRPIYLLAPVLGLLALVACVPGISSAGIFSWANPIVLEFLFGMLLFAAWQRGLRAPAVLSVLAAAGAFAAFQLCPWGWQSLLRPIVWGLPALLLVASAVWLEDPWGPRLPGWILELGNASYSIYLAHTFVLPLLSLLLLHQPFALLRSMAWVVMLGVVLSVAAGAVVYRLIELPIIRHFHRLRAVTA